MAAPTDKDYDNPDFKELLKKYDQELSRRIDGGTPELLTGDWSGTKHDLNEEFEDEEPLMLNGSTDADGPPTPDWARSKADD